MVRAALLYGFALAAAASLLQWLEYKYLARVYSTEIYIVVIAALFAALGAWAGARLTARAAPAGFERNEAALRSLGVTAREYEVLALLAEGRSNKEIARALAVSPNTVKTHVARLFEKLDVARRVEAARKARALSLVP
ncbi:response regulator transcription factor [Amphiplicatus metriothermophilus]|uniref:Transcriptional regulator, LuxR family n=1 Tax=Amphiplicatus metriothermophilus TaxID=1519374 RepID=A0A239PJN1_9PROT|nr:response regulator transcription factor [Amphiplicatus metriothermophilus]MBB5517660.1 DNA-binding CsgD family transcriptional regulator [Amphiplicatus metriothermophilus]SNT68006.1 transcriptional regulator, LuxR family [Amphiplicatus metriothermophilus]